MPAPIVRGHPKFNVLRGRARRAARARLDAEHPGERLGRHLDAARVEVGLDAPDGSGLVARSDRRYDELYSLARTVAERSFLVEHADRWEQLLAEECDAHGVLVTRPGEPQRRTGRQDRERRLALDMHRQGFAVADITERVTVTDSTVNRWLNEAGVPRIPNVGSALGRDARRWVLEAGTVDGVRSRLAVKLAEAGWTAERIAAVVDDGALAGTSV